MTYDLRNKYKVFRLKMAEAGLPFKLTSVARTVKEQVALYAQGREHLGTVNTLREIAGLYLIGAPENKIVTWTLHSKHLIDLDDGDPKNDLSRAFDIVIINKAGKMTWDLKTDVDEDMIPDFEQAAKIGKKVGLKPGAYFLNAKGEPRPDWPHYEI
jgi:hypothetical protein